MTRSPLALAAAAAGTAVLTASCTFSAAVQMVPFPRADATATAKSTSSSDANSHLHGVLPVRTISVSPDRPDASERNSGQATLAPPPWALRLNLQPLRVAGSAEFTGEFPRPAEQQQVSERELFDSSEAEASPGMLSLSGGTPAGSWAASPAWSQASAPSPALSASSVASNASPATAHQHVHPWTSQKVDELNAGIAGDREAAAEEEKQLRSQLKRSQRERKRQNSQFPRAMVRSKTDPGRGRGSIGGEGAGAGSLEQQPRLHRSQSQPHCFETLKRQLAARKNRDFLPNHYPLESHYATDAHEIDASWEDFRLDGRAGYALREEALFPRRREHAAAAGAENDDSDVGSESEEEGQGQYDYDSNDELDDLDRWAFDAHAAKMRTSPFCYRNRRRNRMASLEASRTRSSRVPQSPSTRAAAKASREARARRKAERAQQQLKSPAHARLVASPYHKRYSPKLPKGVNVRQENAFLRQLNKNRENQNQNQNRLESYFDAVADEEDGGSPSLGSRRLGAGIGELAEGMVFLTDAEYEARFGLPQERETSSSSSSSGSFRDRRTKSDPLPQSPGIGDALRALRQQISSKASAGAGGTNSVQHTPREPESETEDAGAVLEPTEAETETAEAGPEAEARPHLQNPTIDSPNTRREVFSEVAGRLGVTSDFQRRLSEEGAASCVRLSPGGYLCAVSELGALEGPSEGSSESDADAQSQSARRGVPAHILEAMSPSARRTLFQEVGVDVETADADELEVHDLDELEHECVSPPSASSLGLPHGGQVMTFAGLTGCNARAPTATVASTGSPLSYRSASPAVSPRNSPRQSPSPGRSLLSPRPMIGSPEGSAIGSPGIGIREKKRGMATGAGAGALGSSRSPRMSSRSPRMGMTSPRLASPRSPSPRARTTSPYPGGIKAARSSPLKNEIAVQRSGSGRKHATPPRPMLATPSLQGAKEQVGADLDLLSDEDRDTYDRDGERKSSEETSEEIDSNSGSAEAAESYDDFHFGEEQDLSDVANAMRRATTPGSRDGTFHQAKASPPFHQARLPTPTGPGWSGHYSRSSSLASGSPSPRPGSRGPGIARSRTPARTPRTPGRTNTNSASTGDNHNSAQAHFDILTFNKHRYMGTALDREHSRKYPSFSSSRTASTRLDDAEFQFSQLGSGNTPRNTMDTDLSASSRLSSSLDLSGLVDGEVADLPYDSPGSRQLAALEGGVLDGVVDDDYFGFGSSAAATGSGTSRGSWDIEGQRPTPAKRYHAGERVGRSMGNYFSPSAAGAPVPVAYGGDRRWGSKLGGPRVDGMGMSPRDETPSPLPSPAADIIKQDF